METIQQIVAKISSAQNPLIIVSSDNADSLASGLALKTFLSKLEKTSVIFSSNLPAPKLAFLPSSEQVVSDLDLTKNLVLEVSIKKTAVAELSYKKSDDKLSIFLKPATGGELTSADVSFGTNSYSYDLLVLIGISSLEHLGEFYSKNTALFFETPIVNIDFRASNENYGQLNLVELKATSCSEIVFDLINDLEASLIDQIIATQLLAGIIAETNSFQHVRTTPQTFLKASQLVGLGANQQEIIARLYKTKSLGLLKLWGRVLGKMKQVEDMSLAYSVLNPADLTEAGANADDSAAIIKEMASQLGFAKMFLFIMEVGPNQSQVYFNTSLPIDGKQVFARFAPVAINPQTVRFAIPQSGLMAEANILEILREQKTKLNPQF